MLFVPVLTQVSDSAILFMGGEGAETMQKTDYLAQGQYPNLQESSSHFIKRKSQHKKSTYIS